MNTIAKPVVLAGFILMIVMGIRQTVGLFVQPIVAQGIIAQGGASIVEISMAFAIGQLVWGLCQPIFGAWTDKGNAFKTLFVGALCLALGQIATMWALSPGELILTQGLLSPAGAAAGSFSILIGIVAARIAADKRSVAGGFVNASGSIGQFLFAPLVQMVMQLRDYRASLLMLAGSALLTIIPARLLCRIKLYNSAAQKQEVNPESKPADLLSRDGLREQIGVALRDKSYLLLSAGFFTCGFHVAFLTTHLPGEAALCGHAPGVAAAGLSIIGLSNIVGSIAVGYIGKHVRQKFILASTYALRALIIVAYLFSAKTEMQFYLFSCAIGLTWLATVSPTAVLVGKLFGMRYLATLFGLAFLAHQIGAFFGAWLGGAAMQHIGNLDIMWIADAALALMAALVNLPIKEKE
ncbi:MAG: MFS transporter [Deltaproteobacteria bacterium]|nr:MFS transporter [Deltaproteobacteria bacterium]